MISTRSPGAWLLTSATLPEVSNSALLLRDNKLLLSLLVFVGGIGPAGIILTAILARISTGMRTSVTRAEISVAAVPTGKSFNRKMNISGVFFKLDFVLRKLC